MAAKNDSTIHSPLARVERALGRKNFIITALGGVMMYCAFVLLEPLNLSLSLHAIAAIAGGLLIQFAAMVALQASNTRYLAPIDRAVENIARLGADTTEQNKSIEQRLLDSQAALESMQTANAQSLLDAKLVGVRVNHLDAVINTLSIGVMVFDAEARVAFANRALSPMIGQQSKSLTGQRIEDWCDLPDLQEYLSQRILKKQHSANSITVNHPQRPNRWIRVEIRDLVETNKEAYVACFYDSTDEVLAQKARSDFVISLSHELKTPLHVMNLYAETLRGPDGEDADIRLDAANVIGDEIERIDSLIRNLLDATRIETGTLDLERTRVRLPELMNDCLSRIQANMQERQITLISNIPNAMQPVFLDKTMFSVALNNLLSNAVKYNNDQGTITVDMKESDESVDITISDTGVGIPEKDLPYVFDKFYRASNVGKDGHGVGLSLAREIIQKHHGRLTVDSTVGEGTTFSLSFNKSAALTREAA